MAVLVAGAWTSVRGQIPGPVGGPDIAVDVNTMMGAKGPSFALPDGDGKIHRVAPGATGRPLVVISHMGFY
jgi:hypothetical protein